MFKKIDCLTIALVALSVVFLSVNVPASVWCVAYALDPHGAHSLLNSVLPAGIDWGTFRRAVVVYWFSNVAYGVLLVGALWVLNHHQHPGGTWTLKPRS